MLPWLSLLQLCKAVVALSGIAGTGWVQPSSKVTDVLGGLTSDKVLMLLEVHCKVLSFLVESFGKTLELRS